MTPVWHEYAEKVVAGEIVTGNLVRLACERHLRDLQTGGKRGLAFDEDAAGRIIGFYRYLRHTKGRWGRGGGQTFALAPWQQFVLGSIFGWKIKRTGLRRFRIAYCEVPRKNGKSTLSSGVALYLLVADGEPGAEVYTAATTKDQAKICWLESKRMVLSSPPLRKRVTVTRDALSFEATNSTYKPLASDADRLDGLNPHGCIVDELHAHPDRELWDVLDTATGARDQSLIFAITTAGNNRQSVCWEQHEYGRKIVEGVFDDDRYFAFVAGPDKGDDPHDPVTWEKANPSYGVTVDEQYMLDKSTKAKNNPASMNGFKQKHLDIWVSKVIDQVITADRWQSLQQSVDDDYLRTLPCWMGLDLASTRDITALAKVFRDAANNRFVLRMRYWLPEETIAERTARDKIPYDVWTEQGWIETTRGATTDYEAIRAAVVSDCEQYDVREIAVDRLFQGQWVCQTLEDEGLEVFAHGQGFLGMALPTKTFLESVFGRMLSVDDNPVTAWMADNLTLEEDSAGNQKPSKRRSSEKIDGIVAAVMAHGRASLGDDDFAYDHRGVMSL